MNSETIELLRELAEKLGTTTEYLWGVLIQQSYISGVFYSIVSVFILLSIAGVLFITIKKTKIHADSDKAEWDGDSWVISGGIIIVLIVFFINNSSNAATALLNPEYWALKQIIK